MDGKREKRLKKYWEEELTLNDKVNLIKNNHFWGTLATFPYKQIPEDLKELLWLKTQENAS